MSAFTLGSDHIDLLITVAMRVPGFNEKYINIPKTADLLGQDLLNENYASVNYRYSEEEPVPEYHWQPVGDIREVEPSALLLLQILNAVHCYEYQSCEHPAWTDSKAFWVSQAIENWCELKLTELQWPKVHRHGDTSRPPAFDPPAYMAWEWTREKGLDFDVQEQDLQRRMGQS
ncbi:MAG: hypothetical protein ACXVYB_00160 [Arthrobacter sp.]